MRQLHPACQAPLKSSRNTTPSHFLLEFVRQLNGFTPVAYVSALTTAMSACASNTDDRICASASTTHCSCSCSCSDRLVTRACPALRSRPAQTNRQTEGEKKK